MAGKLNEISNYPKQMHPEWTRYVDSLYHPFDYTGVKIPTGYPVKSVSVTKHEQCYITINSLGTILSYPGGTIALVNQGTPFTIAFNPSIAFDAAAVLQITADGGAGSVYLLNYSNVSQTNTWSTNYSGSRLVSAGLRYRYTGPPIYAAGYTIASSTNNRVTTDITTLAQLLQDPDNVTRPITKEVELLWMPIDENSTDWNSMSQITTLTESINYLSFFGYNYSQGFSIMVDYVTTWELIPRPAFEPISGSYLSECPRLSIDNLLLLKKKQLELNNDN